MALKVLISWSGDVSHKVALALRDWLPTVLPAVETWVSSEDIPKGARWGQELATELDTTDCGIVCIVPGNEHEPWLNFEAGALSKRVQQGRVHPFLLTGPGDQLVGPLSQFQATEFTKNDVRKLVASLDVDAGDGKRTDPELDRDFNVCWAQLEATLGPLAAATSVGRPRSGSYQLHASATVGLSDEQLRVLRAIADSNVESMSARELAAQLGIHRERAQHLLESLEARKLVDVSYNAITGPAWRLSRDGRTELVNRAVL